MRIQPFCCIWSDTVHRPHVLAHLSSAKSLNSVHIVGVLSNNVSQSKRWSPQDGFSATNFIVKQLCTCIIYKQILQRNQRICVLQYFVYPCKMVVPKRKTYFYIDQLNKPFLKESLTMAALNDASFNGLGYVLMHLCQHLLYKLQ